MDRAKACGILEIKVNAEMDEIKKKYRNLIRKVHPDAEAFQNEDRVYPYSAQEINEAYAYLCEHAEEDRIRRTDVVQKDKKEKNTDVKAKKHQDNWKAKENKSAYCERKIFHELLDEDGEKLGDICVAEGKFYWTADEDFTMFLKSMFTLSKDLLENIDEEIGTTMEKSKRFMVQAELSYLLSAQFLDGEYSLAHLTESRREGEKNTYHFAAMLETNGEKITGEILSPKKISAHKLYLQDEKGVEVGYLSFLDDRLYYVIIPLFEQRLVQVKMKLLNKAIRKRRGKGADYRDLDLWLRFKDKEENELRESLNTQIEKILLSYKRSLQE